MTNLLNVNDLVLCYLQEGVAATFSSVSVLRAGRGSFQNLFILFCFIQSKFPIFAALIPP